MKWQNGSRLAPPMVGSHSAFPQRQLIAVGVAGRWDLPSSSRAKASVLSWQVLPPESSHQYAYFFFFKNEPLATETW